MTCYETMHGLDSHINNPLFNWHIDKSINFASAGADDTQVPLTNILVGWQQFIRETHF